MRAALLIASLLLLPGVAFAARLTAVRVGVHAGYARVVLETDAAAEYELVGAPAATPGEVTVRIAATSRAREVTSSIEGAPAVALVPQDDGSTLATIRASGPLRVETQVLSAPPRVVLDLHRVAAEAPSPAPDPAPAPEPIAEAAPTAPPEAIPIPEPTPTSPPVVATPEPTVATSPAVEEPPLPPVAAPPPVSAPARSNAVDTPSLALGIALGLGLALFGFASRRRPRPAATQAPAEAFATEALESLPAPPEAAELSPHELESIMPFPRREPTPTAAWLESLPEAGIEPPDPAFPRSEPQASGEAHKAVPAEAPNSLSGHLPRSEPKASGEVHQADLLRMHQRLDARLAEIADRLGELVARQAQIDARGAAQNEEIASQRAAIARLQRSLRPAATPARPLQVP